jgi:predicted RNA polymerase sigma factor
VSAALPSGPLGQYQLQAAIAAVHAEAPSAEGTDWPQILALYGLLERIAPGPAVALNRAVAVGMVEGPEAGLEALASVEGLEDHHRLDSVRAHLLELAGEDAAAREAYLAAAARTSSEPERRYLEDRAARLAV